MKLKSKISKIDWLIVILLPIIATFISLVFNTNFLITTILFMGLPSLFLSFRCQRKVAKSALFALIFSVPSVLILDYIFEVTAYKIQPAVQFLLLGVIPAELFLWGFLYYYFIILYYEYFLEEQIPEPLTTPSLKYFVIALLFAMALFFTIFILQPAWLQISFAYLKIGFLLVLLPILLVLFRFPVLFTKFFKAAVYFFYFTLTYEIVALKLGNWFFWSDQFIGWINILGVRFPFEELFFWIMLCTMAVLSFYEFFDDDRK